MDSIVFFSVCGISIPSGNEHKSATSSFHLRIDQVGSVDKARAIQGHDTLEMTRMNGGYFVRWINPGRWQVLVKATAPYKDCWYDLTVGPGEDRDLGEIHLTR